MHLVNLSDFRERRTNQFMQEFLSKALIEQKKFLPKNIPAEPFQMVAAYAKFILNMHNFADLSVPEECFKIHFQAAISFSKISAKDATGEQLAALCVMYCQAIIFEEKRRLEQIEFPFNFSEKNLFDAEFHEKIGKNYRELFRYEEQSEEKKQLEDFLALINKGKFNAKLTRVRASSREKFFKDPNEGLPFKEIIALLSEETVTLTVVSLIGKYFETILASAKAKVVLNANRVSYMIFEPISYLDRIPTFMEELAFSTHKLDLSKDIPALRNSLESYYELQSQAFQKFGEYLMTAKHISGQQLVMYAADLRPNYELLKTKISNKSHFGEDTSIATDSKEYMDGGATGSGPLGNQILGSDSFGEGIFPHLAGVHPCASTSN